MSDTPETDEWYVTENHYETLEIFDAVKNETICGVYGGKTIGEQYEIASRIADLPKVERERDEIDSMYQKIIKEVLECDPIPSCQRGDGQIEPPWEVIARIREQRDEAISEATNAVNDIIGIRWKLNSLVEACQNLIDVKGRHNTEIAFNKMKSILESITKQTNEMGRL